MYRKSNVIIGSKNEIGNYIEGYDIYNSALLYAIDDPKLPKSLYTIEVYEYRPDLIARDFYGSTDYLGLLVYQAGIGLENYKRGTTLRPIPKEVVDLITKNL